MQQSSLVDREFVATAITGIAAVLIASCVVTVIFIVDGIAIWLLWGWFAVPNGAPVINVPMAMGIGILFGVLSNTAYVPKEGNTRHAWNVAMKPVLAVAFGFIVKQFI